MNRGTFRLEPARIFVKANWRKMTDAQLAEHLKMSLLSIRRLRYRLGLIRTRKI